MNGEDEKNGKGSEVDPQSNDIQLEEPNINDRRTFNSIKPITPEFDKLLRKKEKTLKRGSVEELRLQERYTKKSTEGESKLGKAKLQAWSKLYGYKDVGELSLDIDDLKSGKLPSKAKLSEKELVAAKEEVFNTEQAERRNRDQMRLIEKDLTSLGVRKGAIAEKSFLSGVEREVSDLPTKANVLSRDSNVSTAASISIKEKPFRDYTKAKKQIQKIQDKYSEELLDASQDVSTEENIEKYQKVAKKVEKATEKSAKYIALERAQKRSGQDLESQFERVGGLVAQENERLGTKAIKDDIGKGKYGSLPKEMEELGKVSVALKNELEKLKKEVTETGSATEKTRKEVDKAEEAYKKQKKVVDEIDKKGGGGSDGRGMKVAQGVHDVGNIINAGVSLDRYSDITSGIQRNQAGAAAANLVNQKYDDYRNAGANWDSASLRRTTGGFWDKQMPNEFNRVQGKEQILTRTESVTGAGGALATIFGTLFDAWKGKSLAGVTGGASSATEQAVNAATKKIDADLKISSTMAAVQSSEAVKQNQDAINYQKDQNRNVAIGFGRNMYESTQGFGAEGASKTFDTFSKKETRDKFANLGLDPNKIPQLVGQAGHAMGAAFSGASTTQQLAITQRAQALDQARVMSSQQYLGNMGQLTQVGGGSKQMEEIMANAVARGVGNAKNITDIVSIVAGISAKSNINVAAGATAMVSRQMDALSGLMPGAENEAIRQKRAAQNIDVLNQAATGTGMDYQGTMQYASMSNEFGDVSDVGRFNMQKNISLDDINQLKSLQKRAKGGDKTDATKAKQELLTFARTKASSTMLDESGNLKSAADIDTFIEKIERVKVEAGIDTRLIGLNPEQKKKLQEYRRTGNRKALGKDESFIREVITTGYNQTLEEYRAGTGSQKINQKAPKTGIKTEETPEGGLKGGAGEIVKSQVSSAKMGEKTLAEGEELLGGKEGTLKAWENLAKQMDQLLKSFDPKQLQKEAGDAGFNGSIGALNKAADKWDKGADKWDKVADKILGNRPAQVAAQVTNVTNDYTDAGSESFSSLKTDQKPPK